MDYMSYLYDHLDLLMYLRYNPRWYKILYYEPSYFKFFLIEAKKNLKITGIDKLESFKNRFNMLYSLAGLFSNQK